MKKQLLFSLLLLTSAGTIHSMLRMGARMLPRALRGISTSARSAMPVIARSTEELDKICAEDAAYHADTLRFLAEMIARKKQAEPYMATLEDLLIRNAKLDDISLHSFWQKTAPFTDRLCSIAVKYSSEDAILHLKNNSLHGLTYCYDATVEATKNPELLSFMIEHGAPLNGDLQLCAPLVAAVEEGNIAAAEILLNAGANPNKGNGYTCALTIAVQKQNPPIVALLLERGANPNFITIRDSPYKVASQAVKTACEVEQLLRKSKGVSHKKALKAVEKAHAIEQLIKAAQ